MKVTVWFDRSVGLKDCPIGFTTTRRLAVDDQAEFTRKELANGPIQPLNESNRQGAQGTGVRHLVRGHDPFQVDFSLLPPLRHRLPFFVRHRSGLEGADHALYYSIA